MEFFLMLLVKHAIADLGIQAQLQNINKSNYFGNGHIHYLHHGIGTLVMAGLCVPLVPAVLCAIIDYIIHWHIDFTKHKVNKIFNIESRSRAWWWTNVMDQIYTSPHIIILLYILVHCRFFGWFKIKTCIVLFNCIYYMS